MHAERGHSCRRIALNVLSQGFGIVDLSILLQVVQIVLVLVAYLERHEVLKACFVFEVGDEWIVLISLLFQNDLVLGHHSLRVPHFPLGPLLLMGLLLGFILLDYLLLRFYP